MLLWTAAFAIGLAVVYGVNVPEHQIGDSNVVTFDDIDTSPEEMKRLQNSMSLAAHSIYGGFHRFAWSVAIGWVIFACCRGYGGMSCIGLFAF